MIVSASNSMRSQQKGGTAVDVGVEKNAEDDTEALRDEESQSRPRKKRTFGETFALKASAHGITSTVYSTLVSSRTF